MKHFLSTQEWSLDDLQRLIDGGRMLRDDPALPLMAAGRSALPVCEPHSDRTPSVVKLELEQEIGGDPGRA